MPVGDQRCAPCHIFDTPAQCHKMRAEKKPGRRKEGMGIGRDGEGAAPFRRESEGQKGVGEGGEKGRFERLEWVGGLGEGELVGEKK